MDYLVLILYYFVIVKNNFVPFAFKKKFVISLIYIYKARIKIIKNKRKGNSISAKIVLIYVVQKMLDV